MSALSYIRGYCSIVEIMLPKVCEVLVCISRCCFAVELWKTTNTMLWLLVEYLSLLMMSLNAQEAFVNQST